MAAHLTNETGEETSTLENIDGNVTVYCTGVFDRCIVNVLLANTSGTYEVIGKVSKPSVFAVVGSGELKFELIKPGPLTNVTVSTKAVS